MNLNQILEKFSLRLREVMASANIDVVTLSKRTGLPLGYIQCVCDGRISPSYKSRALICTALALPTYYMELWF